MTMSMTMTIPMVASIVMSVIIMTVIVVPLVTMAAMFTMLLVLRNVNIVIPVVFYKIDRAAARVILSTIS